MFVMITLNYNGKVKLCLLKTAGIDRMYSRKIFKMVKILMILGDLELFGKHSSQ